MINYTVAQTKLHGHAYTHTDTDTHTRTGYPDSDWQFIHLYFLCLYYLSAFSCCAKKITVILESCDIPPPPPKKKKKKRKEKSMFCCLLHFIWFWMYLIDGGGGLLSSLVGTFHGGRHTVVWLWIGKGMFAHSRRCLWGPFQNDYLNKIPENKLPRSISRVFFLLNWIFM